MNFKQLIVSLSEINEGFREQSLRAVNISLTLRNWFFGFYIVEFEQNGKDKAAYGKALLSTIAAEMKALGIPNMNERELRRYRQFYLVYPIMAHFITSNNQIRGLLPPGLLQKRNAISPSLIRGMASPN
jgi:hypothetical protein